MLKVLYTSAIIFAVQSIAFGLNAAELPRHEAPFGLRFGMSREEVQLPLSPPPGIPDYMKSPDYAPEFTPDYLIVWSPYHSRKALLEECADNFDDLNFDHFHGDDWYNWIASKTTEDERGFLRPFNILKNREHQWYERFIEKQGENLFFVKPNDFRWLSIHQVKIDGALNDVCLIFTEDGLTSIYIHQRSLENVIDEILKKLSLNSNYKQYSSKRDYVSDQPKGLFRSSKSEGKYVFESQSWLDQSKKIIVASKYIKDVGKGDTIVNTGMLNLFYFSRSQPIPYISYTDVLRRGRTFARYKNIAGPILTEKISKYIDEEEEMKKILEQLDQKEQEFKKIERERLIESFK